MALSQDQKGALKLAQIHQCCRSSNSMNSTKMFEEILEKEGDINYAIPEDYSDWMRKRFFSKSTALHFAYEMSNVVLFNKLLNIGADFTKQNNWGQTVLHTMVKDLKRISRPLNDPLIDAVLSAHINSNNFENPYDNRGLSHFHIACMTKDARAVQFFLDNGISVDEPVHVDTKILPGCTPLHLAAMCTNTIVAELLLANGANMHATDASGMTVLHALIKCRIEIFTYEGRNLKAANEQLQEQVKQNEVIINMLMENMSSDNDCLDNIGLSNFQVACILCDISAAQHLIDRVTDLDHSLNANSQLWPGYTALHFAAHVSLDTVEMLVQEGANFGKPDSLGITPLDICIERYKIEDVCRVMSLNADWVNITFSDGRTNLISFLRSFTNGNQFKRSIHRSIDDMSMFVPMESPLWPGFTPLHLAVRFAEKSNPTFKEDEKEVDLQIIRLCLKNGSDLSAQDSRGRTALHLAYRLKKMKVVHLILRHSHEIPNAFDEDNLSHLHIVCALNPTKKTFKKCVIDDSNVNEVYRGTSSILRVRPGSTPLHVCLVSDYPINFSLHKIKQLLKYRVDPNIKDAYGLTPIHWLLNTRYPYGIKIDPLMELVENDCVAEKYGLSYLHVAVYLNDIKAAKRLLDNGANVNLITRYTGQNSESPLSFLSHLDNRTLLNMTRKTNMRKLLIDYEANVFLEIVYGLSKNTGTWQLNHSILKILWNNIKLQTLIRREFGWTRLHLACSLFRILSIKLESIVRAELADVNAKIYPNSTFCKGYTPLHLLMQHVSTYDSPKNVYSVSEILLRNGADVTISNDEQITPITMLFRNHSYLTGCKQTGLLMKYHRDFNVNPVNSQGISHFHSACRLSDVDAVKGFLAHGVEVNHQIDCFSKQSPGCTPLHLASNFEVVNLLINHGADINIEDVNGHTAIYKAVKLGNFDENIINILIESGASINGSNYRGETPLEVALSEGPLTMDRLTFFIRQGFIVNSCNPITGVGYIAIAVCRFHSGSNLCEKLVLESIMNERSTNTFSRTTLHCLVTKESVYQSAHDYALLIEKVIKSGCDIDGRDQDGKTALHLAVKFECTKIMQALLMCGADINVPDVNGHSALSYASNLSNLQYSRYRAEILLKHACRLAFLKLDLSHSNEAAASEVQKSLQDNATNEDFRQQIDTAKAIELGVRSMGLRDFLSETGAVVAYRLLTKLERSKIDQYFESIHDDDRLKEIKGFLKLQYRKAVKRSELYSSAICPFSSVLGLDLPHLCAANIIQYLSNSDLQNIISASIEKEDSNMDVD